MPSPPSDHAAQGNPFSSRAVRPGALSYFFSDGTTAAALVERLARQGWRGQIVGPHGTGKSTLLAALLPLIEAAGRRVFSFILREGDHRLPPALRSVPCDGEPTIVIFDGYEQLGWISRWCLKSFCRRRDWGLLVTAHKNVGLPPLWTTATSTELAAEIVDRLQHGFSQPLGRDEVTAAVARHGGNLRDALFDLYDQYERQRR